MRVRIMHTGKERETAIQLALKVGVTKAAKQLDLPYFTLNHWVKNDPRCRGKFKVGRPAKHDETFMSNAIALADTMGVKQAAIQLDVNPATLGKWRTEAKKAERAKALEDVKPTVRVLAWHGNEKHEFSDMESFMAESGAKKAHVEFMRSGRTWKGWNIIEVGE